MAEQDNGSPPLARLSDLRRAARDYVQRAIGHAIDTSPESLAFIDHYAETVRRGGELRDAHLHLLSAALGVHLGDVAIARFGGRFLGDGDDAAGWRVELAAAPLSFSPIGMAAEALLQGAAVGYDTTLKVPPELEEPLSAALARSAPVDEEYFYSLTGRFETIEYALELLVEIGRQQREPQASGELT